MDVHEKLAELTAIVEQARSMPMSASCVVNRGEVLGLIEEIRALLPEEFRHAQMLLADRESVVDEGRREAQRLINRAEEERLALTSETEVVSEAMMRRQRSPVMSPWSHTSSRCRAATLIAYTVCDVVQPGTSDQPVPTCSCTRRRSVTA